MFNFYNRKFSNCDADKPVLQLHVHVFISWSFKALNERNFRQYRCTQIWERLVTWENLYINSKNTKWTFKVYLQESRKYGGLSGHAKTCQNATLARQQCEKPTYKKRKCDVALAPVFIFTQCHPAKSNTKIRDISVLVHFRVEVREDAKLKMERRRCQLALNSVDFSHYCTAKTKAVTRQTCFLSAFRREVFPKTTQNIAPWHKSASIDNSWSNSIWTDRL